MVIYEIEFFYPSGEFSHNKMVEFNYNGYRYFDYFFDNKCIIQSKCPNGFKIDETIEITFNNEVKKYRIEKIINLGE